MNLLITAGPTQEAIDPVRFITNHSSGKMGYALAEAAVARGWSVTLVSGPTVLQIPQNLSEFVSVISAAEMAETVKSRFSSMDAAILCAAVADYRPIQVSKQKIKKTEGNLILELERTEDILKTLGERKISNQILVGFAAETDDIREHALEKLRKKNLDWIAANRVGVPNCGFCSSTNEITLYNKEGKSYFLPMTEKKVLAVQMLDLIFS